MHEIKSVLLRLLHWGPILATLIIKCITLSTLHVTNMWLSAYDSIPAFVNHLFFLFLVGGTMYNLFCSMFFGPGYVSLKWTPENPEDTKFLQYCTPCGGYKPPRAHHCRKCQRCVMKMDHHCPWINNCCGHYNHANFVTFLLFAVVGAIHSSILLCTGLFRAYYASWYFHHGDRHSIVFLSMTGLLFCVFSVGLAIGVIVAVGGLLYLQIKIILRNQTSIEEWIVTKAKGRKRDKPFVFPYNVGRWKNIQEVFKAHLYDGINWPVAESCDQYTLTVEQIRQKGEKKVRACQFRTVKVYNGRWCPLFSYGCRTCMSFPISDEPRIALNVGDDVMVTRWKKRWLYGEKLRSATETEENLKGWFPKDSVVEVVSPILCSQRHVVTNSSSKKLN